MRHLPKPKIPSLPLPVVLTSLAFWGAFFLNGWMNPSFVAGSWRWRRGNLCPSINSIFEVFLFFLWMTSSWKKMKYQILSFFGEIHWQWFQTRFKKNRTEASNEVKHQIHFKFQAFKDRRNEWETMVVKVGLMKISSKWHSFTKVAGQRCGELFQRVNSLSFPNKLFGTWTVLAQKRVFFFVIFFKPDEIPSNLFTLNITKWTNEWWILIIWDGFPFEGASQRLKCGLGGKEVERLLTPTLKNKRIPRCTF